MSDRIDLTNKLSVSQILSYSFNLYKERFMDFLKISLVICIPIMLISLPVYYFIVDRMYSLMPQMSNFDPSDTSALLGFYSNFFKVYGLVYLYIFGISVIYTLYYSALIRTTNTIINNEELSISNIAVNTLKLIFPLFLITLIIMIFLILIPTAIGFVLCILPGIAYIIFVALPFFQFYIHAITLEENNRYFGAIGRSFSFGAKAYWFCMLFPLVSYIIVSAASGIITGIIGTIINLPAQMQYMKQIFSNMGQTMPDYSMLDTPLSRISAMVQMFLSFIVVVLTQPIISIVLTIKFLNIKNIHEGTSIMDEINVEKQDGINQ